MIKSAQMNESQRKASSIRARVIWFLARFLSLSSSSGCLSQTVREKKMKEIKTGKSNNEEKTVGRRRILNICIYFGPRIDH